MQEKKAAAEREVKSIGAEIEKLRIWQNPNMVRWFYLYEADEGFNRHAYISWFPGGDGVGSKSDMKKGMEGEANTFWEDMDCEISARAQENLADGTYKPQPARFKPAKPMAERIATRTNGSRSPILSSRFRRWAPRIATGESIAQECGHGSRTTATRISLSTA
ncbi:MAG TPA: hypothetical protein VFE61_32250 [Candidatus Sulfotelmatobacter sp.]|nr:hypothetical protein [Candidatus Sulfotelmatobacter sp.]